MEEFKAKGYERRYFFPHRIVRLPRPGPDGYKLANRMCGVRDLRGLWELVIYGAPAVVRDFPPELFFDRDLVWHEQHLGLPGHVAYANMVVEGGRAWSFTHVADLVQRSGRAREHKTRVDNTFRGWPRMLVNAIAHAARDLGATELRTPTSALAMEHTDPKRDVEPELFERVYDRSLRQLEDVRAEEGWWVTDLERNADRIVVPEANDRPLPDGRVVCLSHDTERGLGHLDVEPEFAREADAASPESLERMLAAEREAGVRATYCVVGSLLDEVRGRIEADGHCVAFHSFDHDMEGSVDQLAACRQVDYRIKGYRAPRSVLGPDLSDERLAHHGFEWLASSARSLGIDAPELRDGIVRVPVHLDDFSLHSEGRDYADWESEVLALVDRQTFTAIGLHDCYAPHWLPHFPGLLARLQERAELITIDEAAARVLLASAT